MALVKRDPFARTELHRERYYQVANQGGCSWCGSEKEAYGRHVFLYQYRNESDGGRNYTISGLFCSTSCMRAYHEG